MKEKHMNLLLITVLLCADAVFLYTAYTARTYKGTVIGPFEFSKYLGIALAVLGVLVIINNLRAKDGNEKVKIANFDLVLSAIAATALLLILWQSIGLFYLWGFLYVFFLFLLLGRRDKTFTKRDAVFTAILSGVVVLVIYLMFKALMGINL